MNTKNELHIPCSISLKFLHYGLFAVLCQLIFMMLSIDLSLASHSMELVRYTYVPYLEYPIVSVTLIIGGAFLIDYITIKI